MIIVELPDKKRDAGDCTPEEIREAIENILVPKMRPGPDEEYHRNMEELGKLIRSSESEEKEKLRHREDLEKVIETLDESTAQRVEGIYRRSNSGDIVFVEREKDSLSEEELMASRCLEKDIEDQLDAAYDRDNPRKIILVDMRDHNERVIDHVIDRFTGWDVRPPETSENLYPFVPR